MNMQRVQLILERSQREEIVRLAREQNRSVSEMTRDLLRLALRELRQRRMEQAAQVLAADYRSDPELTAFTVLDGEEADASR